MCLHGIRKALQRPWAWVELGISLWAVADLVLDVMQAQTYWEFSVQVRIQCSILNSWAYIVINKLLIH